MSRFAWLSAALAVSALAAETQARATQIQLQSSVLGSSSLDGIIEEDIGKVAYHKISDISGEVVYVEQMSNCSIDTSSLALPGKVALLNVDSDCESTIAARARELVTGGVVAIITQASECLCANRDVTVNANAYWCGSSSCLQYLTPRGDPEADTLSAPLVTMSLEDFGTITDCLGDTDYLVDTTNSDSCAASAPTLALTWTFNQSTASDLVFELVTSIGSDIDVNPLLGLNFLDGIYSNISASVGTWVVRPPILDGSNLETSCSNPYTCGSSTSSVNCQSPSTTAQNTTCQALCTNGGRYCLPSVDFTSYEIEGSALVEESLRQICIMQQGASDSSLYPGIFQYLRDIELNCLSSAESLSLSCSQTYQNSNGINTTATSSCVSSSGGTSSGVNTLLAAVMATPEEYIDSLSIIKAPSYRINNVTIPFGNNWGNILSALCASLSDSSPAICDCIYDSDEDALYSDDEILSQCFGIATSGNQITSGDAKGRNIGLIVGLTVGLVVLFVVAGVVAYCRFCRRNETMTREQELQDMSIGGGATGATRSFASRCFGKSGPNSKYPEKQAVSHV
mmetsp:Transcript_3762/g.8172  ORF Transcript_3762/g.8172 Transcript_3762/m.8172 type:complete len:569 (+) Transcript_3762:156-1862(+)|eukprot:CAMPEP_0171501856 /NCGR_PEP_ID=MMETSP0958-20121227/9810_1 /TAXON_ID=87120 /ORGANISM="Aurantiochytrium limacinum, Strain ATCCMYA-1381" /LENGTH=568 /DNA_ID=CAMNT_0012036757 /DNA_START=14 /DNA_END=1720 /DNA_ORIENTATION=+